MLPAEAMCARGCVGGWGLWEGGRGKKGEGRAGSAWPTSMGHACTALGPENVLAGAAGRMPRHILPATAARPTLTLAELRHVAEVHVRDAPVAQRKDVAYGAAMGGATVGGAAASRQPAGEPLFPAANRTAPEALPKSCTPLWGSKHKNGGPRLTRMRVPVEQAKLEQLAQAGDDAGSDEGLQIKTTGLDALHISAPIGRVRRARVGGARAMGAALQEPRRGPACHASRPGAQPAGMPGAPPTGWFQSYAAACLARDRRPAAVPSLRAAPWSIRALPRAARLLTGCRQSTP